jgi:chromosome segregation ATPase
LALSSDDPAGSAFAKGMLERELEPELDFGFAAPAAGQDEDAEAYSAITDARSKADELERRASELKAEVADLERQARSAQDRLELARMEAERAAKQLDSARRRLANAQTQSEDARAALGQIEQAGP